MGSPILMGVITALLCIVLFWWIVALFTGDVNWLFTIRGEY